LTNETRLAIPKFTENCHITYIRLAPWCWLPKAPIHVVHDNIR